MSVVFDLYVPGSSWFHRLDPRVKLWAVALGSALAFLMPEIAPQVLMLLAVHGLLLGARVPWRSLRWLWRQMMMLIVLILLLQPFFYPAGATLFAVGPLRLTVGGITLALELALRAVNIAFIIGGLLFTTEQRALVQAFVRIGLPYHWGLTLSLTLRFLPAIQDLFVAVREAQAARGWVAEGSFIKRLRDHLPVLIAVVIGTLRLSDQLTLALAARGLGASANPTTRTTWHPLRMRRSDWIALAGITIIFIGLLMWKYTQLLPIPSYVILPPQSNRHL